MPIRRRPIRRAAVVGAAGVVGYTAGKAATAKSAAPEQPPPAPPAGAAPAAQAAPQEPSPPPATTPSSMTERVKALSELKTLLDSGAVTQEEYDRAKKNLLEGMS